MKLRYKIMLWGISAPAALSAVSYLLPPPPAVPIRTGKLVPLFVFSAPSVPPTVPAFSLPAGRQGLPVPPPAAPAAAVNIIRAKNNTANTALTSPVETFVRAAASPGPTLYSARPGPADSNPPFGGYVKTSAPANFYALRSVSPPAFIAAAALVADTNGNEFFSYNATRRWPLASVSKLMTAVVATEDLPPDRPVTITPGNFLLHNPGEGDPALQSGDRYTVKDLLSMALLPSSNEAADALANADGRANFMSKLNARAAAWGMNDTYFDEATGLSVSNQTTARDVRALAAHIYLEHPEILEITRKMQTTVTELDSQKSRVIKSINLFAGQPDFIGGKTGYTDEAGGNLISIFKYQGQPLIIVVLGTTDRFGQTEKLWNWFQANFAAVK